MGQNPVTAKQLSTLVHAKKEGRKKWVALCPVHGDHKPSLSIQDGRHGVVLSCRSHRCSVKDICSMWGISVRDLFYSSMPKEHRRVLSDREKLERLEHRLGWLIVASVIDKDRPKAYYAKAIAGIEKDIARLRETLYPWDSLWLKILPEMDRWMAMEHSRRYPIQTPHN